MSNPVELSGFELTRQGFFVALGSMVAVTVGFAVSDFGQWIYDRYWQLPPAKMRWANTKAWLLGQYSGAPDSCDPTANCGLNGETLDSKDSIACHNPSPPNQPASSRATVSSSVPA